MQQFPVSVTLFSMGMSPPIPHPEASLSDPSANPSPAAPLNKRIKPEADALCVADVLAGKRERFGEIIERYQDAVVAVVRGYVKDAHAAEDVAQDVFINAFTALPQLRQPRLFFPWLLQIARHRAAQSGRKLSRQSLERPLSGEEPQSEPAGGEAERVSHAMGAVEQLPEPYRNIVILKYERGLSCKEIAAQENVPLGTITSRLTRALMMLRDSLGGP